MSVLFGERTWPELQQAVEKDTLIVLPVSQVEEHGPHMPVETDHRIGIDICRAAAEKAQGDLPILVMPGIWSGYSNKEMAQWPGTIRVQPETLIALVFDICSSLIEMGFKKIVVVNSHGQHKGILEIVARKIGDKHDVHIAVVNIITAMGAEMMAKVRGSRPGGICHAGEMETSLMLYLTDLVDMSKAESCDHCHYDSKFKPLEGSSKVFWSTWATENSKKGMLGDPTLATREKGEKIFNAAVANLAEFFIEYHNFEKTT